MGEVIPFRAPVKQSADTVGARDGHVVLVFAGGGEEWHFTPEAAEEWAEKFRTAAKAAREHKP